MDADVDRYCRNLRAEMESAVLYRMLAAAELAEVYRRLASVEERPDELSLRPRRMPHFGTVAHCIAIATSADTVETAPRPAESDAGVHATSAGRMQRR